MRAVSFSLPHVAATLELGGVLARLLSPADAPRAVMLHGDMGSGKTTLVRGLVLSLPGGEEAEVASPSFTIANMYSTTPPIVHADLFRCPPGTGLPEELEEALGDDASPHQAQPLVFVEWPEHLPVGALPLKRLDIFLEPCQDFRRFSVAAHGTAAERVCAELGAWLTATHPAWQKETR